jgi:hypothetical protein
MTEEKIEEKRKLSAAIGDDYLSREAEACLLGRGEPASQISIDRQKVFGQNILYKNQQPRPKGRGIKPPRHG